MRAAEDIAETPADDPVRAGARAAPRDDDWRDEDIGRVITGDEAAATRFVRHFGRIFLGVIRKVLLQRVQAPGLEPDLLQDAFVELFRNDRRALRAWDPARGRSLKNFLCEFVRNRTIDQLRVRRLEDPVSDEQLLEWLDRVQQPAAHSLSVEIRDCLERVAEQLHAHHPEDWPLFRMLFLEDRPAVEIAAALGVKVPALHQRALRLRARLRQLMLRHCGGCTP